MKVKKMRTHFLIGLVCISSLLGGCQSVPPRYSESATFTKVPKQNEGKVLFSTLRVPISEPGVKAFYILGALAGANTNIPFEVSIFDVTNDHAQFLGQLSNAWISKNRNNVGAWLEYSTVEGKHTFMLTYGGNGSMIPHVDFVEVNVDSQQAKHIAVTQRGFMKYVYFYEILLNKQRYETCTSFKDESGEQLIAHVKQYMSSEGINLYARDFLAYCMGMSTPGQVVTPTGEVVQQVTKNLSYVEVKKQSALPEWQKSTDKNPTYDLMHSYEPMKTVEQRFGSQ